MKRYTQGFKYFGPMEQSRDGEWCRYNDSANEIYRRDRSISMSERKIRQLEQENKDLYFSNSSLLFLYVVAILIVIGVIVGEYLQ